MNEVEPTRRLFELSLMYLGVQSGEVEKGICTAREAFLKELCLLLHRQYFRLMEAEKCADDDRILAVQALEKAQKLATVESDEEEIRKHHDAIAIGRPVGTKMTMEELLAGVGETV